MFQGLSDGDGLCRNLNLGSFSLHRTGALCTARAEPPDVLVNFPVNDSRGDCSSCPWRDFRGGRCRFATINYAQF